MSKSSQLLEVTAPPPIQIVGVGGVVIILLQELASRASIDDVVGAVGPADIDEPAAIDEVVIEDDDEGQLL